MAGAILLLYCHVKKKGWKKRDTTKETTTKNRTFDINKRIHVFLGRSINKIL